MSSEVNPFSSPRTEIRADQVDTFNVDGDRLLVPAHGDWPDICIDCGCATDQRVTVRLGHRPGEPGKTVQLPICADHRTSRQRGLRVTTACVIGFLVAIPVVLLMPSGSINAILVLSCILGQCDLRQAIAARLADR